MPTYDYKCPECGAVKTEYRTISERHNAPECHGAMSLTISTPRIAPIIGSASFPGYECPVTGEYVDSRKRRNEIMREHNLIDRG